MSDTILVENVNHPGKTHPVDAAKYTAMKAALLAVAPTDAPGLAVAVLKQRLLPLLPETLFPGGETAGWWLKCVQLDLEAKGVLIRAPGSPVRLRRC